VVEKWFNVLGGEAWRGKKEVAASEFPLGQQKYQGSGDDLYMVYTAANAT